MKKPILSKIGFVDLWKNLSLSMLIIFLMNAKSFAQPCASLINVPVQTCASNTVYTYLLNNYVAANTYSFNVIGGSATVDATNLPNVRITWHTVGNVVIVMAEVPFAGGSCTNDTIRTRVGSLFAPQVDCNDTINISLDEFCQGRVTPEMVLESSNYNPLDYEIVIRDGFTKIPIPTSPTINSSHIGKYLEVSAIHRCSGNSCWGILLVEDKLKPKLACRSIIVNCSDPILPTSPGIGFPKPAGAPNPTPVAGQPLTFISNSPFYDNCGPTILKYSDRVVSVVCPPTVTYLDTIFRLWTATDSYGNTETCQDTILVRPGNIDSVKCPPSYDGVDRDPIACSATFPKDANGNPHPSYTGYPTGFGCRNINYAYTDTKLNVCNGSYKILREWIIVDWCSGRDTECVQLIKIIDDRGPVIVCRPMQTVSTIANECTGSATIGLPTVVQECSPNITWVVKVKRGVLDPRIPPSSLDAVTDGVVNNKDNTYTINDLPVGLSWVLFIATDGCGNSTECATEVRVEEKTKPIPVCQFETVVALTTEGTARVYAESFDDGSYDNCALDSMKVKRMVKGNCTGAAGDSEFGPYVEFCCADIKNNPIIIIFQVKDKAGNTNECMVQVTVQDKKPPVVTCLPSPITVSCKFDYSNLNVFGQYRTNEADRKQVRTNDAGSNLPQPIVWGMDGLVIEDCNLTTTYDSSIQINSCGVGTITRTFTFKDDFNPVFTCRQIINVTNPVPYNGSTIVFPRDTVFNGCLNATDPSATGRPSWPANISCSSLIAGYDDQVFNLVENACFKILRKWTVIDDCNPSNSWSRVQIIKVADKTIPTFTSSCANKTFDITSDNCTGFIELIASATDLCTNASELAWSYKIFLNSGSTADISGSTNNASGVFPRGTHRITWTVEDRCGNSATCSYTFTGNDKKAPNPYCRTGIITVIMPSSGNVAVWASDLNLNSNDNCSPQNSLRYSFSTNPADASRTYTCAQIPNGISETFDVRIYVTDERGNQNYCDTKIIIQDGLGNACPDRFTGGGNNTSALVAGNIHTGNNNMLEQAMVSISGQMPNLPKYHITQIDGKFAFPDIPLSENYVIRAEKNDDLLNGVTTQDIILIQKHILGTKIINDPYKTIAADVNDSRSITSRDISDIRKAILGITEEFPVKKSWRFINASVAIPDPLYPWPIEESVSIQNLSGDQVNNNMVAVKLGDVSGDARTSSAGSVSTRSDLVKNLSIPDGEFEAGELVHVPVTIEDKIYFEGIQLQVEFNSSILKFENINNGICSLQDGNLNLNKVEEGVIRLSWNQDKAIITSGPLFELVFTAVKHGKVSEHIALSHQPFAAELYSEDSKTYELLLSFRQSEDKVSNGFYLYQNQPNPFDHQTNISFVLPKDDYASLKIFDVNGRLLKEISKSFKSGLNTLLIDKRELATGGILYYKLETSTHRATRKMIMIE